MYNGHSDAPIGRYAVNAPRATIYTGGILISSNAGTYIDYHAWFCLPCSEYSSYLKSGALPDTSSPIMSPNSPSTELKISMTKILTNLGGFVSVSHVRDPEAIPKNSQSRIGCIRKRSTTPIDPHGHTTDQVAHAHGQAGPEQGVAGVVVR